MRASSQNIEQGEVITLQNNTTSELLIERLDPEGQWKAMTYLPADTSVDYGRALLGRYAVDCDFEIRLVCFVTRTRRTMEVIEP